MSNLTLIFTYQGKPLTLQCTPAETLNQVFQRYCTKAELKLDDVKFYMNSKELRKCDKTLAALGISNRTNLDVILAKYVIGA